MFPNYEQQTPSLVHLQNLELLNHSKMHAWHTAASPQAFWSVLHVSVAGFPTLKNFIFAYFYITKKNTTYARGCYGQTSCTNLLLNASCHNINRNWIQLLYVPCHTYTTSLILKWQFDHTAEWLLYVKHCALSSEWVHCIFSVVCRHVKGYEWTDLLDLSTFGIKYFFHDTEINFHLFLSTWGITRGRYMHRHLVILLLWLIQLMGDRGGVQKPFCYITNERKDNVLTTYIKMICCRWWMNLKCLISQHSRQRFPSLQDHYTPLHAGHSDVWKQS